ncbi:MAG: nickel pincer cofactor biosynthesis protein LarC [Planctomycetales bacterium]|nr:nickel pincer cofactor biosynthesis protein LarC [Planctomycetales bacterium]
MANTVLYLDCASGISGDMLLGALVDAGADLTTIQAGIDSLGLPDCRLELAEVKRHAFRAAKVTVHHAEEHAHRHLHHITEMIDRSRLTERQQDLAKQIFQRLGEAEAKVHGSTLRKVHFHEVGAADSIADIAGAAIGLDLLQPSRIVCSPVPTGHGTITIAHGRCSIPAPATAELLKGIPLAPAVVEAELTTPTGAAIVATVVDEFGPLPAVSIDRIGYGAGDKDFAEQANVLRLIVGTAASGDLDRDQIVVLETNLDDVTGEVLGYCTQRLLAAGALDVYTTAIFMKKNRPASTLTVICRPGDTESLESIIFRETQTLGVRRWRADRNILARADEERATPWGPVKGKRTTLPDGSTAFFPEYEDCRRLAEQHDIPLQFVLDTAKQGSA